MKKTNKIIFFSFLAALTLLLIAHIPALIILGMDDFNRTVRYDYSEYGNWVYTYHTEGSFHITLRSLFITVFPFIPLVFYPKFHKKTVYRGIFIGCTLAFAIYIITSTIIAASSIPYSSDNYDITSPSTWTLFAFAVLVGILCLAYTIFEIVNLCLFYNAKGKDKAVKKCAPIILKKLKALYDDKVLTQEEYEEKRKKYISML